jgi:periplasmic protein TonB
MSKKTFISILSLFFTIIINAQVIIDKKEKDDEDKVFTKVNIEAYTNEKALASHINKYTQLPDSAIKNIPAGTYKISIQFVIDIHGNIGQIKALDDPGYGLSKRALIAVSTYNGEWKPANQCGRNVKAYRKQPIVFIVPAQ